MAEEKKKKGKVAVAIIVVLVIFVVVPTLILGSMYLLSEDFQMTANGILSGAPGAIGEHFAAQPTREEINEQVKEISLYMLDIERARAVDKLVLLKSEDETTYERVVRSMLRINPNATRVILEEIRQQNMADSVVTSTLQQIQSEKEEDLQGQADYLSTLTLQSALVEMQKIIDGSINGHMHLANTLALLPDERAAELLGELSEENKDQTMQYFSDPKVEAIRAEMTKKENRRRELENLAGIYRSQPIEALVDLLGNTNTYPMEELAILYEEMGPLRSGKLLSNIQDDNFTFELLSSIKENELKRGEGGTLTEDIRKALKIYAEYDDNVRELAHIYENMTRQAVADNLRRMIRNADAPSEYTLENGESITITDEMIAIDLLRQFSSEEIGEILSSYDETLASEITRRLAVPSEE